MTVDDRYLGQMAALTQRYPLIGQAMRYHVTTRGRPLTFSDTPFIVEPMRDFLGIDGADVMKGVQTRWTELFVQMIIQRAGWEGRTSAYILPTARLRDGFVQRRINPVLNQVPEYRSKLPWGLPEREVKSKQGAENLRLKHFGKGMMMFLGSNRPHEFVEWSADIAVVDELDHCDQDNLALLPDRLKASPYPQTFRLGNPTMPGIGIAQAYLEGDQRQWFMQCPHCNERQVLDWFAHVVEQDDAGDWRPRDRKGAEACLRGQEGSDIQPVCLRCHKPFQRQVKGALWVAERPSEPRRSYRIGRLEVLTDRLWGLFLEWMRAQSRTRLLQRFVNSILGLAYSPPGTGVTDDVIQRAATAPRMDHNGGADYAEQTVTMGVDVGTSLNVSVSVVDRATEADERDVVHAMLEEEDGFEWDDVEEPAARRPASTAVRRNVWTGIAHTFSQLEALVKRYNTDLVVVDAGPETHKAQEFRDKVTDEGTAAVWLCRFHPRDKVGSEDYGMRLDYGAHVVTVDRTQLLDATLDDLVAGRRTLPQDIDQVEGYLDQMKAPKRMLSERGDRYIWDEGSKADHYRFSDAYDRVAFDLIQRGGEFHVIG